MKKYYITYGAGDTQPHKGGWTEVYAHDEQEARDLHEARFGRDRSGFLRFSDIYDEEQWPNTITGKKGANHGHGCWDILASDSYTICE